MTNAAISAKPAMPVNHAGPVVLHSARFPQETKND